MIELPADMGPTEFIHGDFRKTMYTMMNLGQLLLRGRSPQNQGYYMRK